jgi:methyl-accepting chemotaxis protein
MPANLIQIGRDLPEPLSMWTWTKMDGLRMAFKFSIKSRATQLSLAQAFAGFGIVLLLMLGITATIISTRVSAIDELARTTRDQILPESAKHVSAALATERLMQLTMRMSYATTASERNDLKDQAAAVAMPFMQSQSRHHQTATADALKSIQHAAATADKRDQHNIEILAKIQSTDNFIKELTIEISDNYSRSEQEFAQMIKYLTATSDATFSPFTAERLQQNFTTAASAQKLLQYVHDARKTVSSALRSDDLAQVSNAKTFFLENMNKAQSMEREINRSGSYKNLSLSIKSISKAVILFDLHSQQITEKALQISDLDRAMQTLTNLADQHAAMSNNLATTSANGIINGVENIQLAIGFAGAIFLVMVILIGLITRRLVIVPIQRSVHVLAELGAGRSADPPPAATLRELNMLGGTVAKFANALRSMAEMKKQKSVAAEEEERRAAMRQEMRALANEFESTVMASVSQIGRSADELRQSSDFMSDAISATETLSHSSRDRAAEARENVDGVAAGSQQIASSIGEIETAASDAAQRSQRGADAAANAKASVSGLTDDANRIGEVVNLVSEITKRTNLLALNATIEAARAGEAGRGFAIVAGEVKQLAGQTAEAAHEIVEHVKRIRDGVTETSDHIEVIADVVASTSDMADMIASSVSQQAATTRSIADRAGGAAAANVEVADLIAQLNEKARSGNAVVEQVSIAANEIHNVADTLCSDVDGFITGLRARAAG